MKRILIAILILALIGGAIAYRMWNKPHENIAETKSVATVTSSDLFKSYSADEKSANEKYMAKVITVSGKVAESKVEEGKTVVTLQTEDPIGTVVCSLDPYSKQEKTSFAVGDQVSFKGICNGFLSDVIVDRCVLVK